MNENIITSLAYLCARDTGFEKEAVQWGKAIGKGLGYGLGALGLGTLGSAAVSKYNAPSFSEGSALNPGKKNWSYTPFHTFEPGADLGTGKGFESGQYGRFAANNKAFEDLSSGIRGEMDNAFNSGDMAKGKELQQKLESGNFGGSTWYKPWTWSDPTGKDYMENARSAQGGAMESYNKELAKFTQQPGDEQRMRDIQERMTSGNLLPSQANGYKKELEALRRRINVTNPDMVSTADAIRKRMTSPDVGMRFNAPPPPEMPGMPAGNWPVGARPLGFGAGAMHDPNPTRPVSVWDDIIGRH